MDLKALKTFRMIVGLGSFNQAAEALNYAQSTVTMQIRKLESDLGVQLFERGKKIRLTDAGRLFYEQSEPIVSDLHKLQTRLSDWQAGVGGTVRLGVTEPAASRRLPAILAGFTATFPQIGISLDIANSPTLHERLLKGELDMALSAAPNIGADLYFEPLFKETFSVLIPTGHPLAERSTVALRDIGAYRLLITAAHCPYRKKLDIVLRDALSRPLDTMEVGSMSALPHFVAAGLGLALVPDIVLMPPPDGTVARPLDGAAIDMTCGLACKASSYPLRLAGDKLYQWIRKELTGK